MSGFLQDRVQVKPGTGLASFFGSTAKEIVKSELVILLTPVLVRPGGGVAAGGR
jgi:hypothetical protein